MRHRQKDVSRDLLGKEKHALLFAEGTRSIVAGKAPQQPSPPGPLPITITSPCVIMSLHLLPYLSDSATITGYQKLIPSEVANAA